MIGRLKVLLRGDADRVAESVSRAGFESIAQFSLIILMGAGVYGATLGLWRGPLQAFYTAIKFPLVIFLTCLGNGAINGMLAQILGSGLSFRQTAVAILMSFAIAAIFWRVSRRSRFLCGLLRRRWNPKAQSWGTASCC